MTPSSSARGTRERSRPRPRPYGAEDRPLTLNLDSIGFLPCNPSVGGTAKGHLVREIDALGGEMGLNADLTALQYRMLNTGKGAAVQSLRAQTDKNAYHREMKRVLEHTENLRIVQGEAARILTENGKVSGVVTNYGGVFSCRAAVIATGVYLNARTITGKSSKRAAPTDSPPLPSSPKASWSSAIRCAVSRRAPLPASTAARWTPPPSPYSRAKKCSPSPF